MGSRNTKSHLWCLHMKLEKLRDHAMLTTNYNRAHSRAHSYRRFVSWRALAVNSVLTCLELAALFAFLATVATSIGYVSDWFH